VTLSVRLPERRQPACRIASSIVTFMLTNRCLYQCRHCVAESGDVLDGEMDSHQVVESLHNIKDALDVSRVILSGGEPLLKKDFAAIYTEARSLFDVYLISTGLGLTPALMELFSSAPPVQFRSSFYGLPDTHDSFCHRRNAFSFTKRALEFFARTGAPTAANILCHKENVQEVPRLVESLLSEHLVDEIRLVPVYPFGRGREIRSLVLGGEDWTLLEADLLKRFAGCETSGGRFVLMETHLRRPSDPEQPLPRCSVLNDSDGVFTSPVHIDADGDIYTCLMIGRRPHFSLGNILRIWEIDLDRYYRAIRDEHARVLEESCSSCAAFGSCSGGCFGSHLTLGRDYRCDWPGLEFGCLASATALVQL